MRTQNDFRTPRSGVVGQFLQDAEFVIKRERPVDKNRIGRFPAVFAQRLGAVFRFHHMEAEIMEDGGRRSADCKTAVGDEAKFLRREPGYELTQH